MIPRPMVLGWIHLLILSSEVIIGEKVAANVAAYHVRVISYANHFSLFFFTPLFLSLLCKLGIHYSLLELAKVITVSHHMANKHTIILMQTSPNRATRTFMDYGSITQAMDGICGLYESKLKQLNPAIRNITYDIGDLYNFIDGLADMSALVFDHSIQAYLPYDRQWIKQRTFQHLKKLAN